MESIFSFFYSSQGNSEEAELPVTVLSIDGGGAKGVIVTYLLSELERRTNMKVMELFDCCYAASVGSLITAALNIQEKGKLKFSAQEVHELFIDEIPKVFHRSLQQKIEGDTGLWPKFKNDNLKALVERVFDGIRLTDLYKPWFAPSLEERPHEQPYYITRQKALEDPSYNWKMSDVLLGTMAAETYFPAHEVREEGKQTAYFADGGFFCNNPASWAFAKTQKDFACGSNMVMLSLGTGKWAPPLPKDCTNGGDLDWLPRIISTKWTADNQKTCDLVEYALEKNFMRCNPVMNTEVYTLDTDNPEMLKKMVAIQKKWIKEHDKEFQQWCDRLKDIALKKRKIQTQK